MFRRRRWKYAAIGWFIGVEGLYVGNFIIAAITVITVWRHHHFYVITTTVISFCRAKLLAMPLSRPSTGHGRRGRRQCERCSSSLRH